MTPGPQLPEKLIAQGDELWRIHSRDRHPAHFNTSGEWRFDPPLAFRFRSRFGTCYLGSEPLSAFVEVFGRVGTVLRSRLEGKCLSGLSTKRPVRLADLTSRLVAGFGIDQSYSHSSDADYDKSQRLAAELQGAGWDGIFYGVRHDPAGKLRGVALFGPPGEGRELFSAPKTGQIPAWLVEQAQQEFGIEVVGPSVLP